MELVIGVGKPFRVYEGGPPAEHFEFLNAHGFKIAKNAASLALH
jgi:hypothetical protein